MTVPTRQYDWENGEGNAIDADQVNAEFNTLFDILDGGLDVDNFLSHIIPSGLILPYGGSAAPSGWLICDGSAVSRATYANLYAAIGTSYGVGDGSTTFNLPDLRGRSPVGKGTHADVDTLGESDGVAEASRTPKHTLTTAEIPAHAHSGSGTNYVSTNNSTGIAQTAGLPTGSGYYWLVNTGGGWSLQQPGTANTGGGGSHNHGFQVVNFLVKT